MKAAVLFSFVGIIMAACTASSPKEQSHATTPATAHAPKTATIVQDGTPPQRSVTPDTTTKYTQEDGGMTQIESKFFIKKRYEEETSTMQRCCCPNFLRRAKK